MPYVNAEYVKYGENKKSLIVLCVFYNSNDPDVLAYENNIKSKYPAISGASGGYEIFTGYDIQASPHYILVAPNKKIVEKKMSTTTIGTVLAKYLATGIDQCNEKSTNLTPSILSITSHELAINSPSNSVSKIGVFNTAGKLVFNCDDKILTVGNNTLEFGSQGLGNGAYILRIHSLGTEYTVPFSVK